MNSPTHIRRFVVPTVRESVFLMAAGISRPKRASRARRALLVPTHCSSAPGAPVAADARVPARRVAAAPGSARRTGAGPGAGRSAGEGRWGGGVPLRPARDGVARGHVALELPFTLGHENAGWIESLARASRAGRSARRSRSADRGAAGAAARAGPGWRPYASARRRSARRAAAWAVGGMAEYMLVPDPRLLVRSGSSIRATRRRCRRRADAVPRDQARAPPARPRHECGCDRRRRPRPHGRADPARAFTARSSQPTSTPASSSSPAPSAPSTRSPRATRREEIRELTRGRGATLVLDCVGNNATLALDAQVVAKGGDVMVIGIGGGSSSTASTRCRPTRVSPTRTRAA